MNFHRARRTASVIAVLLSGLASIAVAGPFAGAASAATSPIISVTYPNWTGMLVSGSGFTPGGQVLVQEEQGTTVLASTTVTASQPTIFCKRFPGEPPDCNQTSPGGQFSTPLPLPVVPGCGTVTGSVIATDRATGTVATAPWSWFAMC